MRRSLHLWLLLLAAVLPCAGEPEARLLPAAGEDRSYLLLDASGIVLDARWDHLADPIPVGSLVKPFTALAYARAHGLRYPRRKCDRGGACWFPPGHGLLDIRGALAHSCNTYFRSLSGEVSPRQVGIIASSFRLPEPPESAKPDTLFGLGDAWRIPPQALARAYLELARRRHEPAVGELLAGLALAALEGTGQGLAGCETQVLAKTGTAPCSHAPASSGDGLALALFPADQPGRLLLVRVCGATGRQAAQWGGSILPRLLIAHPVAGGSAE
jgi:hypothetical protein